METESLNLLIASAAGLFGGLGGAVIASVSARRNHRDTIAEEHKRWLRESQRNQRQLEYNTKEQHYATLVTHFNSMISEAGHDRFTTPLTFRTDVYYEHRRSVERSLSALQLLSGIDLVLDAVTATLLSSTKLVVTISNPVELGEELDVEAFDAATKEYNRSYFLMCVIMQQDLTNTVLITD